MSLKMKSNGKKNNGGDKNTVRVLPKAGARMARLVQVIDLGFHAREYKGESKPPCQCVFLNFDLVDDLHTFDEKIGPQPLRINTGTFFPLTVTYGNDGAPHEKSKLRRYLDSLDPSTAKDYNMAAMVLDPCILTVKHSKKDDNTYANIADVGPVPDIPGLKVSETQSEPLIFDLEDPDPKVFESLPDFLKDKIKSSLYFKDSKLATSNSSGESNPEDEVPF